MPQDPLYNQLLQRATSIAPDENAQWYSDHPVLGGLTNIVAPGVDPHQSVGIIDLLLAALPVAGGVAKGVKAFKNVGSGASSAIDDLYGLSPKTSRREFFDRMQGNPGKRGAQYAEQQGPELWDAYNRHQANIGFQEPIPVGQQHPIVKGGSVSIKNNTWTPRTVTEKWQDTPKLKELMKTDEGFEQAAKGFEQSWNNAFDEFPKLKELADKRGIHVGYGNIVYKDRPQQISKGLEDVSASSSNLINTILRRFGVKKP